MCYRVGRMARVDNNKVCMHHHVKPVASQKHKKSTRGTHLSMEIHVGICRTQSVEICHMGHIFVVMRKEDKHQEETRNVFSGKRGPLPPRFGTIIFNRQEKGVGV